LWCCAYRKVGRRCDTCQMIAVFCCFAMGLFAQNGSEFDAPIVVQNPSEVWDLPPLKVMPRQSIASGEVHHYLIEATEGARIEGVVAQYGVDIQLRLWGPNRKKWKTFDYHNEGLEAFRHRAKNHGAYLLEIISLNNTVGEYEIYLAMSEKEAEALPDLAQQVLFLFPPNQPGIAFGVIQKGELLFLGARGLADAEHEIPLDLHVPFHAQYLSFPMYAHAFLELEKKGLVDLDTPVSEVLPWFPDYEVVITLMDLISIHSGLPDCTPLMNWVHGAERRDYSRDEIIDFLSVKQAWKARDNWNPTPSRTDEFLIQEALCTLTGKDIASSMDSLLFEPLGMKDSRMEAAEQYPLVGDLFWGLDQAHWSSQLPKLPNLLSVPFLATSTQDLAFWFQSLTSPSSEWPGAWDQFREWEIIPDYGQGRGLYSKVSPENETVLLRKYSTMESAALFGGFGVWKALFEGWPLRKPGKYPGFGARGMGDYLRNPAEKVLAPFCGEYQCDQGDLRISISRGESHLVLADGKNLHHKLLVARDRESLFTEKTTLISRLVFGELIGDRYEEIVVQLRGSGRATFRRLDPAQPERH